MIWVVFFKECQELLRDRKHLMVTLLLPILLTPLMMFGVGLLQAKAQEEKAVETLTYWLEDSTSIPGLAAALASNETLLMAEAPPVDIPMAIQNGTLDYYLLPERREGQWVVVMQFKESELYDARRDRIKEIIDSLNEEIVIDNLRELGVPSEHVEQVLTPLKLELENLTTNRENFGEVLGSFLPFLIIVWIISAAIAVSSDLVAGEKERGTMETLLISPVPLLAMIGGKWLSITLFSWFAGVMTLVSLWGSALVALMIVSSGDVLFELITALSWGAVVLGCILILPAAGLISAVYLVTGSLASSFKEAQSYASGLMVVFFIPLFATFGGTIEPTNLTAIVPIMNTALAFKGMLAGTAEPLFLMLSVASNSLGIFATLVLAKALYNSERVLSRQ